MLIDGVTAGCQAYLHPPSSPLPSAPVPSSRRSVPSSFNLAAEAKESGERESPRDTARLQTSRSRLFPPPSSPCLFTLPSLLSPPRSFVFISTSSAPQPPPAHFTHTDCTISVMQTPCHFCLLCAPHFFFPLSCLNRNSSTLFFFLY